MDAHAPYLELFKEPNQKSYTNKQVCGEVRKQV